MENKVEWRLGDIYYYINRYYGGRWIIYQCFVSKINQCGHITFITLTAMNTGLDSTISFGINGDVEYGSMLFNAAEYEKAVKRVEDLLAYENSYSKLSSDVNRLKKYDEDRDIRLHSRLIERTRDAVLDELLSLIETKKYEMGELKPFVLMGDIYSAMNEIKKKFPINPSTKKRRV